MITRAKWNNEYVPGYFALMIDTYRNRRAESMWMDMCSKKTSGKKKEENIERSGLGFPVAKGEGAPITYDEQLSGPIQTWVHTVYALGVRITEEAIEDNLYELNGGGGDSLKEIFFDLGEAMAENEETLMARFLVNGTATTYHTGRDALALFSASHTRLDSTVYSNYSTNADLSYLGFWSAVVAAENQQNHRQYRVRKRVKNLWIPPQLERQALEVLRSSDRPDNANNAINAIKSSGRKIGLKVWPHLTDTDAWYLQLEGDGITHFTRRKTRFAREKDFQTGDMMCKGDQRWSAEINDPRCWYGNVPS